MRCIYVKHLHASNLLRDIMTVITKQTEKLTKGMNITETGEFIQCATMQKLNKWLD